MKKYLKYIIIVIILVVISLILVIIKTNKKETACFENINLEEIYNEINSSTSSSFEIVDESSVTMYLPLDYYLIDDYILAVNSNDEEEFFIIMKNLDQNQLNYLEELVNSRKDLNKDKYKDTKINTYNKITYVAFSSENDATIEGIIRNFVYCD